MDDSLFSVIAKQDDEHSRELGLNRAKIAAESRVTHKFAKFVASDTETKIDFVKQDILDTVKAACAEHGISTHEDIQTVLSGAMASLRVVADRDGDSYAKETVELPTATADGSTTGLSDKASPEIDTKKVPEGGLDPIDVPSNKNPGEMQEIRPKDHDEKLKEFDPAHSPVLDQVDITEPVGPEQVGDRTDTWSGEMSAVTSSWRVEANDEDEDSEDGEEDSED